MSPMGECRPVTGAILVGGASRRMGEPKHAMKLADGRTMLEHVAAALQSVCHRIVLLGDVHSSRWEHVVDRRPGRGPLSGLEALLRSNHQEPFLVCPCDMPGVDSALLRRLAGAPGGFTVLRSHGRLLPFPMRIDRSVLSDVTTGIEGDDASVYGLLERCRAGAIDVSESEISTLRNLNTPGDLDAFDRFGPGGASSRT